MTTYYKHVYSALRGAMVNRDMGDKEEDAVLVDFVSAQVALRPELPSAAVLIAYSALYYPGWLAKDNPSSKTVESLLGGVENPNYPLLYNVQLGMIAVAVGVYAGLWTVQHSKLLGTILITPNMDSPLVVETAKLIQGDPHLTYKEARDIFVELMQQEEYASGVVLADDYVANASFIQQASISADDAADYQRQTQAVDLSKEFGGAN